MPVFPPLPLGEWADTEETTTRPMGLDSVSAVDRDLVDHRLEVAVADGRRTSFPLRGLSVAAFHRQLLDTLAALGLPAAVELPVPFDLAVPRFSDRRVEQPDTVDPVTREASSHEVTSAGFRFGDAQVPEPACSSSTAPEPAGLAEEPLRPAGARWIDDRGAHLALLTYEDARSSSDPRAAVLEFPERAYAAARRAGWDVDTLRCPSAPALLR